MVRRLPRLARSASLLAGRCANSKHTWALFAYMAAGIAMTWRLVIQIGASLPGDLLDPLFTCWALGWNYHAWGLDSSAIGTASYWDANIFYPEPLTLARCEHFWPQSVLGAPV